MMIRGTNGSVVTVSWDCRPCGAYNLLKFVNEDAPNTLPCHNCSDVVKSHRTLQELSLTPETRAAVLHYLDNEAWRPVAWAAVVGCALFAAAIILWIAWP